MQNTLNLLLLNNFIFIIILTILMPPLLCSEETSKTVSATHTSKEECKLDRDCLPKENAYCDHATCLCEDNFVRSNNMSTWQCLKIPKFLNDSCQEDVQCQVAFTINSECRNNVCACSFKSHFDNVYNRCYKSAYLRDKCEVSPNCNVNKSFCDRGYCRCARTHRPLNGFRTRCIPMGVGTCNESSTECKVLNSICDSTESTCFCDLGFAPDTNHSQCLPVTREIGGSCESDAQCTEELLNTKCRKKKCDCIDGYDLVDGICSKTEFKNSSSIIKTKSGNKTSNTNITTNKSNNSASPIVRKIPEGLLLLLPILIFMT